MTRKEKFVLMVQAAAIVEAVRLGQQDGQPKPGMNAAYAVLAALEVKEGSIPSDLSQACSELIACNFDRQVPRPAWLIDVTFL